ncbi:alpha/beta hydrolase [Streptomyces sp. NBC_01803]|uniref:alpha/beta hydrolase n=1 Tax=Streptomyces sp. NBC_01803 TaxID=2975946 RepID=UPI002DD858BC|nr:alpha/beta hydrolase [Streptomyces sp. NBC_01803]WSA46042.1 alpha/beta hydrolase [Streptomyces sp. NBC_01803]
MIRYPRRPLILSTATALAAALLATACTGEGSSDDDARPDDAAEESIPLADTYPGLPDELARQRLSWDRCPGPSTLQGADGGRPNQLPDGTPWQCADLTVPLDYEDPEGETIEIALIRAVTSAPEDERIGSLVYNFGGPGGSGVATLPSLAEDYETLRDGGFDLVSFDPRGVGESDGVVCLSGDERDAAAERLPAPPETAAEERLYEELEGEYIAACQEHSGDVLPHVTTANTARDMDLLRHVLGDERLNYFGVSYGTELGAVYAHLFPGHLGRTVLDAVVNPAVDPIESSLNQTEGFQLALDHYLADCTGQSDCPLGDTPREATDTLTRVLDHLGDHPMPTADPDGRELTADRALTGIATTLYSEESWEYLTMALEQLMAGSGDALLGFSDLLNGRDSQGEYSNQSDAQTAITCADYSYGMDIDELDPYRDDFLDASPVFGDSMVWGLTGCAGWPVTGATTGALDVSVEDPAATILLVGTTGDPATPYEGAASMQEAMGGEDVASLLTYDGDGHGAYSPDHPCVAEAVDAHLLTGDTPENGRVCA